MAPRTTTLALADMLENLSKLDFDRFCDELLDRREEPQVRRCRLEGKTRFEVVDVLVSTFTVSGALQVAVQILTQMDCNEEAKRLERRLWDIRRGFLTPQDPEQEPPWWGRRKTLPCIDVCVRALIQDENIVAPYWMNSPARMLS